MSGKRALVVDDSKSARAFLSKMLEEHQLEVDSAETAEQAIDYLTHHRPDVIFMDHLMPGMDGFQAVQAIKSNPRTATIPILMYTSQEGELYLGQARALGALGVLPKQVGRVDVDKVLQQLHLTAPSAASASTQEIPVIADAAPADADAAVVEPKDDPTAELPLPPPPPPLPLDIDTLREELASLRRHVAVNIEQQRERLALDLPQRLREVLPPPPLPPETSRNPWPWALAAAAAVVAVVLGAMLWSERQYSQALAAQFAVTSEATARIRQSVFGIGASPVASATAAVNNAPGITVIGVPFGEAPLAGARAERLRELIDELAASGQAGLLEIRRYAGRFCLAGDRASGYSLAEPATAYGECDLVADADSAEVSGGPAESLAFANLLTDARRLHPQLRIQVLAGGGEVVQGYPDVSGASQVSATAGQWNAAASANNRVEVRWLPES